jgi:hypothetical protein
MNKKTPAQVKNLMHRAFSDLIDPPPTASEQQRLRAHFEHRCAYCDAPAAVRDGHLDHAEAEGGNAINNLVLACRVCNGDEKREMHWEKFLARKCGDDADVFTRRRSRIVSWLGALDERRRPPRDLEALREQAEAEAKAAFDAAYARVRDVARAWRSTKPCGPHDPT